MQIFFIKICEHVLANKKKQLHKKNNVKGEKYMLWTLISFIGFTILVAVISYVKTKDDRQDTSEGYFLAGRGLPGFVIAGSLLLTNLSAEQLVGSNGQTWSVGMSPMAFEVVAAPCCIALALFAAPRYLKSGITTIPQLIGLRFDRSTKLWFSILYIVLALVVQIPVVLYSGSLVFENIFGLSSMLGVTKFQSIVILCIAISVIGSIYAIFGGLKAVAVSDTVNGVGLLIGGLAVPFLALHVLGSTATGGSIVEGMRYLIENILICSTPLHRSNPRLRRFRGRRYSPACCSSASSPGAPIRRMYSVFWRRKT